MTIIFILALIAMGALLLLPFRLWAAQLWPELPGGTAALVIVAAALLYALEHLLWLSPVALWILWATFALSALWTQRSSLAQPSQKWLETLGIRTPLAVCVALLCLMWPLLWRVAFPSLYASSEKLTNLLFLQNFLFADGLPATDRWLPPYKFDFYYPLQYYLMSLPGRMLNLSAGLLYQCGFVFFVASTLYAAFSLGRLALRQHTMAWVLPLVMGFAGTGAGLVSVIWHYLKLGQGQNAAFIALTTEARFNGQAFYKILGQPNPFNSPQLPPEQPLEYFAYQIFLGDFHPTLSGFYLLMVLLGALWILSRPQPESEELAPGQPALLMLLGALPLTMLASNSWLFPHMVMVTGLWFLWTLWRDRSTPATLHRLAWLSAGAALSLVVFFPVLQGLAGRSLNVGMRLVPWEYRGSIWPYIIQFWPLYVLIALSLWQQRLRQIGGFIAAATLVLLLFNAVFYMNDLSVNTYERTNSALKWWNWTWTLGLIGGLISLLNAQQPWLRRLSYAIVGLLLASAIPLLNQLLLHTGDDVGKIQGDHIYTRDAANKSIIDHLRHLPPGIALEAVRANAYDDSGALSMWAEKAIYLGWPDHQYTWRGGMNEVGIRREAIEKLYSGSLEAADQWAISRGIRYILWTPRDCREGGGRSGFLRVDTTLKTGYSFQRTADWGDCPVGVWKRLP